MNRRHKFCCYGTSLKMAAKLLSDVLNDLISLERLFICLSNDNCSAEANIFNDEWSQAEFVSHFFNFLREQSSRIFQSSSSVETPRKNSQMRMIKTLNITPDRSNCQNKSKKLSPNTSNFDIESFQSFPSLSCNTSKLKSLEKALNRSLVTTPLESPNRSKSKDSTSLKKNRRVKLFSEQADNTSVKQESNRTDVTFLDDQTKWLEKENKFTSTPKQPNKDSLVIDYFNSLDQPGQPEISPRWSGKQRWKKDGNRSADLVMSDSKQNHSSSPVPKSKSFNSETSYRSKDKSNSRVSLGDFILSDWSPNDGKKEKKSKARRRINPTKVKSDESQLNINQNDLFDDKAENVFEERMCIKDERQLLKKECESILEQFEGKLELEMEKDVKLIKNVTPQVSEADPRAVTFTKELKQLASIYSFLIGENLCQNIMMELCFILSLLVVKDYDAQLLSSKINETELSEEPKFLDTIHNCVYFAVEMLWLQQNILLLLSKAALKLLSENSHISTFNPALKEVLAKAYCERDTLRRQTTISKFSMQGNVSFQYETDNRENFTSDTSFHSFRKQRDLFYNILAIWESNHSSSGWVFSIGLGSRIRSLLGVNSDPINLLHLARLFRSQLVMSCAENQSSEEESNEDILQLLPSVDPDKMLRLKARLTGSPKCQGPCPLPDFVGHQEFYKEFILCTANSLFHQYLKNSLCDEILRLNEAEFLSDVEDNDSCLDENTKERYHQCINVLRLLAKFLGFVEFLPYRSEKQYTDRIINLHCSVRQNILPLFDLETCLKVALTKHKLILTIPWIVSYLSMIDACSARLNIYERIWQLLIAIYKSLKSWSSATNCFYLKLTLGWVFQLPNFPINLFYNMIVDSSINIIDSSFLTFSEQSRAGLDSHDLVEENVLYSVCPYLNEVNVILRENMSCNVRHIRPVTTQDSNYISSQATKQLELRLEESFLHNQTSSTRKTIEFVTERVSSIGIKQLVHQIIPTIKDTALNELKQFNPKSQKDAKDEAERIADKCHNEIVDVCEEKLWTLCSIHSEQAVQALLSTDLDQEVIKTCTQIVIRQAAEKVIRWMQNHITISMIKREFVTSANKLFGKRQQEPNNTSTEFNDISLSNKSVCSKDSHRLPPEGRGVAHSDKVLPPSLVLKNIRELIWKATEEGAIRKEIEESLEEALKSVKGRDDMIPVVEKTLFFLVVDLLICTCVYGETEIEMETLKCFTQLLKHLDINNYPNSSLERLICPRNIIMITQTAKDKDVAWRSIGTTLLSFMNEGILTKQQIETQLLSFLRHNWTRNEYMQMHKLVTRLLESYTDENACDKFSLLLDLLIDFVKDDLKPDLTDF